MKNTVAVLFSCLSLCGCAHPRQPTALRPAIEQVKSGSDSTWGDGCVLHVSKRTGAALQGVQLIRLADGLKTILTAESGSVLPGSIEDAADGNSIRLVVTNARIETTGGTGTTVDTAQKVTLVLQRQM